MKNIKKQWFTLVELIVVITILAILWSIAFISLQGYSSDARNSKRTSDINSIEWALSTQLAQGQTILSFVTPDTNSQITWLQVAWTGAKWATDYSAGTVNYAALPVKQADFQDPQGYSYAMWVTKNINGKYEIAATLEQWQGSKIAKVSWTYVPRKTYVFVWINTWSLADTITLSWSSSGTGINYFFPWDNVMVSGLLATWTWRTISKISMDGTTITFKETVLVSTSATGMWLNTLESSGLIDAGWSASWIVLDAQTNLPY